MKYLLLLLTICCLSFACKKYSDDTSNRNLKKTVPYFLQDRAFAFAGKNVLYVDFKQDTIVFETDYNYTLVNEFTDTLAHFKRYVLPLCQAIKAEVFKGLTSDTYRTFGRPDFVVIHNFSIITPGGDYVDYRIKFYYDAYNDQFAWE